MKYTAKSSLVTEIAKQLFRTTTIKISKFRRKYIIRPGRYLHLGKIVPRDEDIILLREWINILIGSVFR